MAVFNNPNIVSDGLVFYVDPNNARSYAGYGNTIYNMVNSSVGGTFVGYTSNPIDNTFTRSIVFDGNDYINIPSGNLIYGTAPRTMITWSKISANDGSTHASFAYGNQVLNQAFFIGVSGLNPFCGAWANDLTAGNTTIALNTWFHTACVFDGTTAYLYVAGILTTSATKAWNTSNVDKAYLGRQVDNGQYWNGNIGEASIYNRALSASEILQNYNATRKKYYPEENIVSDGIVLHIDPANRNSYPGTGNTIYDLSGSGITGTLTNGPTLSFLNGASIFFDGSNDYVELYSTSLLKSSPFTVSFWIYVETFGSVYGSCALSQYYTVCGPVASYLGYSNTFMASIQTAAGGNAEGVVKESNFAKNRWYYYCSVYDGSAIGNTDRLKIFIDGVQKSLIYDATVPSSPYTVSSTLALGYPPPAYPYFNGRISNLQIYNKVLTQQEISQNYNATKKRFVNALPLVRDGLVMELDAGQRSSYPGTGNTWYDTSGFSNNAIFINGPTFSSTGTSSSIAFDGTNDYVDMNYPSQINTGSPITLALWAKWTTTGTTTATIQTLVDNNYQTAYVGEPGSIGFFIQDRPDLGGVLEWGAKPGTGITRCTSTFVVGDGKWHYITATNDGANSILYVDGAQSGLARTAAGIGDSQPFINLGRWRFTQTRYLNGNIADFRIYNRALSAYEVKQNFDYYRTRYGI